MAYLTLILCCQQTDGRKERISKQASSQCRVKQGEQEGAKNMRSILFYSMGSEFTYIHDRKSNECR